jgi:hypothetical protein
MKTCLPVRYFSRKTEKTLHYNRGTIIFQNDIPCAACISAHSSNTRPPTRVFYLLFVYYLIIYEFVLPLEVLNHSPMVSGKPRCGCWALAYLLELRASDRIRELDWNSNSMPRGPQLLTRIVAIY